MVGQTTERKFAQNTQELIDEFKKYRLEAKQKISNTKKMILELERDLAFAEASELAWDRAIYELENIGVQTGPKSRRGKRQEREKEDEGEEEEGD